MTINTESLDQAVALIKALQGDTNIPTTPPKNPGRWVIVRGDRSGVFFGRTTTEEGQTVELTECRRVWYWAGAATTTELAEAGTSKPDKCKFTAPVGRIRILDAIEVADCTDAAVASLSAVQEWSEQ